MSEFNEDADRLLHDAQHAHGGADFAVMMRDAKAAGEMREKAAALVREAYALDRDYCERCRAEDDGSYAGFWRFATASLPEARAGRPEGRP